MDQDKNIYDVASYTDDELFQLMNISNPTDRELEHKIYTLMNKYQEQPIIYQFFNNVLKRFFDVEDDDIDGRNEETTETQIVETFEQQQNNSTVELGTSTKVKSTPIQQDSAPQNIKQLLYTKGNLNPLIKESIKRIVSIDSQFRDTKLYPVSTAFTFNLSESLKDIVSMKLYSIQLPYTWYTISDGFGSNFFYIKGNSPGINNGNFDYMISIQSGNYQASDFVNYLNTAFTKIFQENSDVNFGTTGVTYNTVNSKLTAIFDIQYIFNEVHYALNFPLSSFTPFSPTVHTITSIPQLFGYSNPTYRPCSIYSQPIQKTRSDSYYIVDSSNCVFYIYQYQGPAPFNPTTASSSSSKTYVYDTITITIPQGRYKAADLIIAISSKLQSNTSILNSSFTTQDNSIIIPNTFVYDLSIVLNRKKVTNLPHLKYVAYFPDSQVNPLWVGNQSCFCFSSNYQELNSIVSENASEVTTLFINTTPTIYLKCNLPYYGQSDTSCNDQLITIPSSSSTGYTVPQYFQSINQEIQTLSNQTNNSFLGTIDISNSQSYPTMKFNIHNVFYNEDFYIDVSGSIFDITLNFPKTFENPVTQSSFDMSANITSIFNLENGYAIYDATNPDFAGLPNNCITVYSIGSNNKLVPPVPIYIPIPDGGSVGYYADTATLIRSLNNALASIKTSDQYDNSYNNIDMTNSYLTYSINTNGTVSCKFHMDVRAILSERDYDVILSDQIGHSWSKYLYFQEDIPYHMNIENGTGFGYIQGETGVYTNQLYLTSANNFFYVNPVPDPRGGVYTTTGEYNITVTLTLPINNSYTKEQIANNINEVFNNNPLTQGSSIDISQANTIIRLDVNKIFTAKDYRLVFYDSIGFTKCNFGLPTNATYDTVLGWILGFRNTTEYFLSNEYLRADPNVNTTFYDSYSNQPFTYDFQTGIVTLTGDTSINVNLYNYVTLIMDDFTLNRLNDGLVTVTSTDMDIPLPSYASRNYICDVNTQKLVYGNIATDKQSGNHMTANQLYAANQLLANRKNQENMKSSGPFIQDIFALVPIRTNGMQPGQSYIEFGGTLQNQERVYFGPVDISKMSIQLLTDKGTLLDLNNANWSFSLLIEQLYNPNRG